MGEPTKRKGPPGGGPDGRQSKKSKGGNKGRWQTPNHKAKIAAQKASGRSLELGDAGFWVSCQRNKELKTLDELSVICDEYAEKTHGIKPQQEVPEGSDDEDADIEASIKREITSISTAKTSRPADSAFAPMRVALDCLLFVKTKSPVEPRAFVRRICEDARLATHRSQRKSRFINRLTPISLMGRATESGVEEIARTVLSEHFQLAGVKDQALDGESQGSSYAIRYSARAHNTLKREDVIKQVAGLIGPRHKVNLTAPDKVIIIEIFQTFCGMSVVDGDYDALKRYNLFELYAAAFQATEKVKKAEEGVDDPKEAASELEGGGDQQDQEPSESKTLATE